MGFWHTQAAYSVTAGGPGAKAVLVCLADRACDTCGMAWPGIAYLAQHTEIPEKRVSTHLSGLLRGGFLAIHGYGKGGRGRSTEYIVLPQVAKLSTAPCDKCMKMRQTPAARGGFRDTNPPVSGTETPPPRTPHQSYNNQESYQSGEPRSETPPKNPGGSKAALPPILTEPADIPAESLTFLASLGLHRPAPSEGNTPHRDTEHPPRGRATAKRSPGDESQGAP